MKEEKNGGGDIGVWGWLGGNDNFDGYASVKRLRVMMFFFEKEY